MRVDKGRRRPLARSYGLGVPECVKGVDVDYLSDLVSLTWRCSAGLALRSRPSPRDPRAYDHDQRRRSGSRSTRSACVVRSLSPLPTCAGGSSEMPAACAEPLAHIRIFGKSSGIDISISQFVRYTWVAVGATHRQPLHVVVGLGRLQPAQLPNSAMRRSPPTILPNSVPSSKDYE